LFSKDIETMDDLLLHGLKDTYYAKNQIIKSLPKLIDKATNRDLTKGLVAIQYFGGQSAHRGACDERSAMNIATVGSLPAPALMRADDYWTGEPYTNQGDHFHSFGRLR
jgi:hypothetical protein